MMKDARVAGTSQPRANGGEYRSQSEHRRETATPPPIVKLECHVAGEKDPEIRRVGPVKAVASSTGFVAIVEVHLGSGFWRNHAGQVRSYDVADAT